MSKKSFLSSLKDTITANTTKNISQSMEEQKIGMLNLKNAITTKSGEISQNPNLKGFIFEQEHARTFNQNAVLKGSNLRAEVIPPHGELGEPDIIIKNIKTGEVLKQIQAKTGKIDYINRSINDPKYQNGQTDAFVTDSDYTLHKSDKLFKLINKIDLDNPDEKIMLELDRVIDDMNRLDSIEFDGIESDPMSQIESEIIEMDPETYMKNMKLQANIKEVKSGAINGALIGSAFSGVLESIKIIGKCYRGEKVEITILTDALKSILKAAGDGAVRGALVKVVKIIMEKNANNCLPLIIFAIGFDVIKSIYQYLNKEITEDELFMQLGPQNLAKGLTIVLSMAIPPIGLTMMGITIISTIWKEFELDEIINDYRKNNEQFNSVMEKIDKINDLKNNLQDIASEKISNTKKILEEKVTNIWENKEELANKFMNNSKKNLDS